MYVRWGCRGNWNWSLLRVKGSKPSETCTDRMRLYVAYIMLYFQDISIPVKRSIALWKKTEYVTWTSPLRPYYRWEFPFHTLRDQWGAMVSYWWTLLATIKVLIVSGTYVRPLALVRNIPLPPCVSTHPPHPTPLPPNLFCLVDGFCRMFSMASRAFWMRV